MVSQGLGINVIVEENKEKDVNLPALEAGTYEYTCGMGMYGASITVK